MIPLLLAIAGVLALLASMALQRRFGKRARVGRLLAVVPQVTVAEAVRMAQSGERAYVRVDGRIDSDHEFEDDAHRPLVVRRTTLAWRPAGTSGAWKPFDVSHEHVAFSVREGLDEIAVDGAALAEGLVVIPRERRGVAADLGEAAPEDVPADAEVRMILEQASSVEHGTVLGVPQRDAAGRPTMGPGLGRPLILSTLERDEAMRVLTGGSSTRATVALACIVAGAALLVAAALWFVADAVIGGAATVLAASPEPSVRPGTDTRSTGGGPGLVGEPLLAVLAVAGIAALSVAATLAYVRLTGGSRSTNTED